MSNTKLGKTLLIANPASHSGKGAQAAEKAIAQLRSHADACSSLTINFTSYPGDATKFARNASGYDTVVALGGDGVVHEVVCGLMELPRGERPTLGLVALGTGNDYARTLALIRNNPTLAVDQLLEAHARRVEVGHVTTNLDSTYFCQTLSFGLDAAIALDTTKRRAQGSRHKGTALFVGSGIKIMSHADKGWHVQALLDDGEPFELDEIIFAVQVGPSYGAGFKVCPDANPSDGFLDVCYNTYIPSRAKILPLFAAARNGGHIRSSVVKLQKVRSLTLDFETQPPCQVDGEELLGTHVAIQVIPDALQVLVSPTVTW